MKKFILFLPLFYYFTASADVVRLPRCSSCSQVEYDYQQLLSSMKYLHIGTRGSGTEVIHPGLYLLILNMAIISLLIYFIYKKKKHSLGKKS